MSNDNFNNETRLNFGVNTDSFFGIGFGLLGDNNLGRLKAEFNSLFSLLGTGILNPSGFLTI